METIKSYTDIEQSRTLAKRLPIESADMYYCYGMDIHTKKCGYDIVPTIIDANNQIDICDIPCWSLASLLGVLPIVDLCTPTLKIKLNHKYYIELCIDWAKHKYISTNDYDNPIDACVAMIIKLHELNLL